MSRAAFLPSRAAKCPAPLAASAAVGLAILAFGTFGCAASTSEHLVYAGTGSVQTTGVAAANVGLEEVRVSLCRGSLGHLELAAIAVGGTCNVAAEREGDTLVGRGETTCALRVDGREHRLRLTDATATFGQRVYPTLRGSAVAVDQALVKVRMGGDESDGAGGVRHSLFVFEGPLVRTSDAEDWCNEVRARSAPAAPPSTEANAF